ncbi:MAG: BREX system ATP-binding domain-containing protein [Acidobacteriota bacterium]
MGSLFQTLYRITHEPPRGLIERGAAVDRELEALVLGCLEKKPERRPESGAELAAALRGYRDRLEATETSRPSAPARPEPKAGAPPRAPLVGREPEMGQLEDLLGRAAAGECVFAAVGGEAGTGKTRLARELEAIARKRGFLVLRGRFSELETTFAHQAFCELIEDFYRVSGSSASGDPAPPALDDLAAELMTLYPSFAEIPELRAAASGPPPAAPAEESRVFELLAGALLRLSDGRPMVLVLEDLHAGDSGVTGLHYLVRRLGQAGVLVLGTYRPAQANRAHPLSRVLADLEGDPHFVRLTLEPLGPGDLKELIENLLGGPALDTRLVRRLWDATEGNPLFCQQLVRSLVESGTLARDAIGLWTLSGDSAASSALPRPLPATLEQAAERRLESLSAEDRRLLQAAAVLGRAFDLEDLTALDAGTTPDLEEKLDALVDRGLLREVRKSRGERLRFTSGVVRDLLEQDLTRRRRRRLHEAHVRRLEGRFRGQLERVYPSLIKHCRGADLPDETVRYAMALAERCLQTGGAEDAARAARVALDFAEDVEPGQVARRLAETHETLAKAYGLLGQNERVLRHVEQAERGFESLGDRARQASAALLAADVAWRSRQMDAVRRWVARGLEAARGGAAPEALDRLCALGMTVANLHGERSEALYLEELRASELQRPDPSEATLVGGRLRVALPFEVRSIQPHDLMTREEWEIAANLYEPLIVTDDHGLLSPNLCETWRAENDYRAFSFQLRAELRLSDGTPLGAEGVRRGLERCALRAAGAPPALTSVVGLEAFLAGHSPRLEGLGTERDVAGREHLVIRLREPLPILPQLLTDYRTAIAGAGLGDADIEMSPNPFLLGTGPFRLAEAPAAKRPSLWLLERNPYWRGETPRLDSIEFRLFNETWALSGALASGEVDLARDLLPEDLEELVRRPEMRRGLAEHVQKTVHFAVFRTPRVPAPVRRAMFGTVRVRDLVWKTAGRHAVPASGLVPPGLLGHDAVAEHSPISSAEASRELGAADLPSPLALRAAVHPLFLGRFSATLRALIEGWEDLGLKVQVVNHDMASYRRAFRDPETDLLIGRWGAAYEDPDNFTHNLFHSGSGLLRDFFSNPSADRLLEKARLETRISARELLYRRFDSLALEREHAILPLFHGVDHRLLSPAWCNPFSSSARSYLDYRQIARRAAVPRPQESVSGELRVAQCRMLPSLDPAAANMLDHHELVGNIFEPLVRVSEQARIEPWLAASLEPQLGGRAFRIRLRDDVRFHDGRRLSARDVRFSLERLLRGAENLSYLAAPLRGSADYAAGRTAHVSGIVVHSSLELTLELQRALPAFPALLAHPGLAIVPEGCESFAGTYGEGCVGTGPFRVVEMEAGTGVTLERHPLYWREGRPRVERIHFRHCADARERLEEFRAGRLSLLSELPILEAERLRRRGGATGGALGFHEAPSLMTYFLALNRRRGPLQDEAARRALAPLLGLEAGVRALGRFATPARSLVPPGLLGYEPAATPGAADPETPPSSSSDGARRLEGLELTVAWHPVFEERYAGLRDALLASLESVGILTRSRVGSLEELFRWSSAGEVDLIATRWAAVYPDADCFFTGLLSQRGGFLAGTLGGEDLESLIDSARLEADAAVRRSLFRRLEHTLADHHLVRPLFHEHAYCFAQPGIEGLRLAVTAPQVRYEEILVR